MDYTYKQFKSDLLDGREVEFKYKGDDYSITNTKNGFCFCKFYEDSVCFTTPQELIDKVRIDGKSFEEIFNLNEFALEVLY
ncbi:hypothetical protein GOP56_20075 [Brevibacillus sp. 7WMA2]|uniref:Uncharacterized protein n=1 Tax=Brevibacillus halotolerans TaxID=1507437 RepID=A0ABT4I3S6_9BACL|nr:MULTISPECIES: hypothetical protein [Brevibacillus]AYK05300.1 hypothetical protein D8Z77_02080 [Brevibacillus laterosporus]ERM19934.1 hypothetical protein P615_08550 [Brevibacillus laterosporus PE36]MCR8987923.1 hypothetical protein [Brevibacillus laterosporus]MCZ0833662.1 hypothetical protein [Brevibacillus halotolerans]QIC07663.1 hypothetical protein GOP56_20075 [Brevibacillus sp. 7WMA2]